MRELILDARGTRVLVLIALIALGMRGHAAGADAQAQPPALERRFDVASVKPGLSPYEQGQQRAAAGGTAAGGPVFFGSRTLPGGRFMASTVTLKQLVAQAFEVKDYQIEGGPKWLTTDYFDINASAGGEAAPAEINAMLKTLLVERFALRAHVETRQASTYVLTVARSDGRLGSGLKTTPPECLRQIEARKSGATPQPPPPLPNVREFPTTTTCGTTMTIMRSNGSATLLSGGGELKMLVSMISSELSAPVVDRTGLTGLFDVILDFTSERQTALRPAGLDANSNDTPPPPIAVALEQQLGLKVEKQIGPQPAVVIESAEHPTVD